MRTALQVHALTWKLADLDIDCLQVRYTSACTCMLGIPSEPPMLNISDVNIQSRSWC